AVKIGCTVCHEGNPQETDFVLASHTPIDHEQEHEWKEKYYVTSAFIPNITFATVEHYWDRPMYPPKFAEAGCAKCHTRISDIAEFQGRSQATRLNKGQDLFVRAGCVNCHDVDDLGPQRKVGPDLSRIASKLTGDFTEQWLMHPKRFRPSTWMPHFFLQENNGPGSDNSLDPDPVLRTETEVQAITHYLFTISQPCQTEAIPDGLEGDAGRGRELFNKVGCLACHANVAQFGRDMAVSDLQRRAGESKAFAEALYDDKMDYVDRVSYLVEHLPSERDTFFAPETIGNRPVFTRYAPELSSMGSKVSRPWLFAWLKDPAGYYAGTRMPSLRLTDQEAIDLTEYMLTLRENKTFKIEAFPRDDAHRRMADDLVFEILSSQNSARRSRLIMDDADGELTERLVSTLKSVWDEGEARSRLSGMDHRAKRMLFLGNKMIAHYGCYACHNIGGFETVPPPGTNLSNWAQKPISQLDFGFFDSAHDHIREARPEVFSRVYRPEHEDLIFWSRGQNPTESITHTHAAFAGHKMLNPRIWDREKIKAPYDKLKMPNFYFTEDQVDALVTYLLSRREPRINDNLKVAYDSTLTGAIAEGRNLTRSLNCVGCHKMEGNVAAVHQYYNKKIAGEIEFDEVNAPPWLRGEGAKVKYPWLYTFMNQVETLRPWLKIRMPSFKLTDEETATLVKYFAGISKQESEILDEQLRVVQKYIESAHRRIESGGSDDAPDPDLWFATDELAEIAAYLASYGVKNRLVLTYDVDLAINTQEDLKEGFALVLQKTRFTADLFDLDFPFAEQARPLVDEERFKLGEQFFYELKCLACHALGDPNIVGSNTNPSAPNLAMTHNRLRQQWVYQWLQEPGAIQPGSKMPQWFGGGASAFASYGDEDRATLEADFGSTGEEQMQLLMDFMYNAGVKNYTAIQPGGLPDAGEAAFDE
ncbi:MAG: c-type cytochrome, partial [Phycisphaerae bacterium]